METINTTDRFYQDWHDFEILGVPGRMTRNANGERRAKGLFDKQKWVSEWREYKEGGQKYRIRAKVRLDDDCKNGHNSFAITGETERIERHRWSEDSCGCLHDEIAKRFPELASLTKWHGTATDGPMHYIANTCYHASNRDHNGKLKGEPWAWAERVRFGTFPISLEIKPKFLKWLLEVREHNETTPETNPHRVGALEPVPVAYVPTGGTDYKFGPKYTVRGYDVKWHECPFDGEHEAREFCTAFNTLPMEVVRTPTLFSEGKERNLDAARSCAVWPEATDEELMVERAELEAKLKERHPALMDEFRRTMELSAGLMYSVPDAV